MDNQSRKNGNGDKSEDSHAKESFRKREELLTKSFSGTLNKRIVKTLVFHARDMYTSYRRKEKACYSCNVDLMNDE